MKVLLFAYPLKVCGTTVNALEFAAALRDLCGHEVVLFAAPGPMLKLAEEKGLRIVNAPEACTQPSPVRMRALRQAVRQEQPDLVYAWDWPQSLDAFFGVHLPMRVPMAVTSMSMDVDRMLPKVVPTTFGTPELVTRARVRGWRRVRLLLPPVDVQLNAPDAADGRHFREQWGIGDQEVAVVTVSRVDEYMKGESLFRTAETILELGKKLPVSFVIVGDGSASARLKRRAAEINSELGRTAIVTTGSMIDPRPAYAAADIAVCMGGSALRAMAFAKPVIVVGERGFASLLTPGNAQFFHYFGMYGRGDGKNGNEHFAADLRMLTMQPELRAELGRFSREFVVNHFALSTVCAGLDEFCRDAVTNVPRLPSAAADGIRTAAVYVSERRFLHSLRVATPN